MVTKIQKTPGMRRAEVEVTNGKDIVDYILDGLNEHHNQKKVAVELRITEATFRYWMMKLGIEEDTKYICRFRPVEDPVADGQE